MGWIFLFRVHALIRDSPAYAGNTVPRAVKEILDHSREQDQQTALMTEEMESDFQQKAEKYK